MFSGSGFQIEQDDKGAYFIDRDPTQVLRVLRDILRAHLELQFQRILNYLRTGKVVIPQDKSELVELLEELDFYQISGYAKEVKTALEKPAEIIRVYIDDGIEYYPSVI